MKRGAGKIENKAFNQRREAKQDLKYRLSRSTLLP